MKFANKIITAAISVSLFCLPAMAKPIIQMNLDSKKVVVTKGKEIISDAKKAKPGDIVVYTLKVSNTGDSAAIEVQPVADIPSGTEFVELNKAAQNVKVSYSVDGATFSEKPMIRVMEKGKPVMKEAGKDKFNKIKWLINFPVEPGKSVDLSYKVKVK